MKHLLAIVLSAVLLGCGTTSNVAPGTAISVDQSSSVLLLRVSPQYRIHLLRGKIEGNQWVRPHLDIPEVNIVPGSDGYIFVKLKNNAASEKLGVSLVFPEGKPYGPCEGSIGATFDLRPGAITYAGELVYTYDGKNLKYSHRFDEQDAKNYVENHLGKTHPPIEAAPMTPMKVKTSFCEPKATAYIPIYIPIYVPRGR
ncbi:hypothetical protein HZ993_12685 [Rhodoferax sp. AJA081-3]|uniref:hypothetical protein n=1 Tax=Rhodoferax sp. AJA081-3 TaxID=2752316 RepID=UPI001AE09068|nr:hypothetical protein [Rhodoferax sp. AJA081-3]QTN26202.1 hypothetical protein HZ993_12685 [Rhodoferax sp. AJA081-3]